MEELNRIKSGVESQLLPGPVLVTLRTQRRNFFADQALVQLEEANIFPSSSKRKDDVLELTENS